MNNAQLIVGALEQAGVRWAFGVPSGPVLPLIEAMRDSGVTYVLTASETSAAYMAAMAGGLTGGLGVCVSTLGPGATNLATGVGGAWLDRLPVLAITCNVATEWLDRRVQMRIDHHALFGPITKCSLPLRQGSVAGPLAEAIGIARAEPPGPVHVDLPEDVALAPAGESLASPISVPCRIADSGLAVEQLEKALTKSHRPLIVAGLTFTRTAARDPLLTFAERCRLPFITTAHAKGFLPETHPNWAGVLGRARRSNVQALIDRSDLILAVGFDPVEINYEEWAGGRPVFHLSSEPADTGPRLELLFNEAVDIEQALIGLSAIEPPPNEWRDGEWQRHRDAFEAALRPPSAGFALHAVVDVLRDWLPAGGILAYDVGAHHHQIASQWRTDEPWTCLSTNGWSSMGIAMPAAYAAKLVHPDRQVVAVLGDGCFEMTAGELGVARRLGLAVPHIVLADGWLSLIRIKQDRRGLAHAGVFLGTPPESPPHYFGVPCVPAHDPEELRRRLDWALGLDGPSVIEAFIDPGSLAETVYD